MKRLLLLPLLLAAFTLPTAQAFGIGAEVDDVGHGQILDKGELGSFQGLGGLPSVLCKEKLAKIEAEKAHKASKTVVADGVEASSKRGG